ncbi:hypothetical protein CVT25_011699 [Psilocybe cyanescens]|uniref:Uncharacterized protein n=1 Tax=Psilocybe cyanescens TaxID=93625 RepID=A0A409WIH4_PSICY|nr:hypothetical protein CVT25_011699 [Psilocybe cyanescens]
MIYLWVPSSFLRVLYAGVKNTPYRGQRNRAPFRDPIPKHFKLFTSPTYAMFSLVDVGPGNPELTDSLVEVLRIIKVLQYTRPNAIFFYEYVLTFGTENVLIFNRILESGYMLYGTPTTSMKIRGFDFHYQAQDLLDGSTGVD